MNLTIIIYMNTVRFNSKKVDLTDETKTQIEFIGLLTKTSERKKAVSSVIVQPLLVYNYCKKYEVENFFEIGTGRGSTSYIVSLLPCVKNIITIDKIPFDKKRDTFMNFIPVKMSNREFNNLIPYHTKNKIQFLNCTTEDLNLKTYKNLFDFVYLDGNCKVDDVVKNDFKVAEKLLREDGVILVNNYGPNTALTHYIDQLRKTRSDLYFQLIQTMDKPNHGSVLISKSFT